MNYLIIPNLEKHQAYKDDRAVQWIKLYTSILTDYDFNQLPDDTKAHLILLWTFAASQKGRIPDNPKWLKEKLGLKQVPNIKRLVTDGFLVYEEIEKPVQEEMDCCTGDSGIAVPREEKSREENITREEESIPTDTDTMTKSEWMKLFDEKFIVTYIGPRVNKSEGRKSWARIKPSKKLFDEMMASLEKHKACKQWNDDGGKYIPASSVWLNQERWLNEPDAVLKSEGKVHTGNGELAF